MTDTTDNTTVYRLVQRRDPETLLVEDHEELSTDRAVCDDCGREGWRGDWPGQGGIVPDDGKLICDECAQKES